MKVLHVLNELKPSGAETMLRSAAPFWREHGVSCEILATGAAEGEFAAALKEAGYPVHHLPRRRTPGYFVDFRNFVREGGYALVHQHAEGASYWFGLAAMSAGARLVRTMHNNFAFDGHLRWRRGLQRRHLQALGARFVAIAPGVQQNEEGRFGVRSQLVWNWIDTDRFQPISAAERAAARARWGYTDTDLVLLTLGNCSPVKNHGALIEALARVPDLINLRYLHVGMEDKACAEQHLAEQLGVAQQITFTGWLPNAREALAAADVYVMPSLYEGLGLAAIEALGVGLPAVLSRVDGLRDLEPLFPGLTFVTPEPEAIAEVLRAISRDDPQERMDLASGYSAVVAEKFSVARGVREYCDIYHSAGRT